MTDISHEDPRPDLSDRAKALSPYLRRAAGEYSPFGDGYAVLGDWIRNEILNDKVEQIGHDGINQVIALLGEDFPLADNVRELWSAASSLSCLFGDAPEPWTGIQLGMWIINWVKTDDGKFAKRMVLIDCNRPIPKSMRHWFEKAGIYQPKDFGLHRDWHRTRHIFGASCKPRFVEGTVDRKRHFRVIPDLDRMDICDGNFDRWANSRGASVQMPRTHAEFEAALDLLVSMAAPRVAEQKRTCS